jgi:uncharacterized membrane protein YkoI
MRRILLGLAMAMMIGPAGAESTGAILPGCLSPEDMQEAVSSRKVVAPLAAIRAARLAVPRAEVVRARLCHHDTALMYQVMVLRRDGRFVQVLVNAASGEVASLQ